MKKKHIELLQSINRDIPIELKQNIMKKVDRYALFRDLMEKALKEDDFPEDKKRKYRNLLQSKQLEVIDEEIDDDTQNKINDFINNRIKEEIENKNLPKYAFSHLFKKTKKINK